jgi:hypothetical protein
MCCEIVASIMNCDFSSTSSSTSSTSLYVED